MDNANLQRKLEQANRKLEQVNKLNKRMAVLLKAQQVILRENDWVPDKFDVAAETGYYVFVTKATRKQMQKQKHDSNNA